jgi:hypothetical protein
MVAKNPAQMVPEPAYRRIESSYQSNLWVASLPLTSEEEESLRIEELDQTITISSNFWTRKWTHALPLPSDAILSTVTARTSGGILFISAELEDSHLRGKEVPIFQVKK